MSPPLRLQRTCIRTVFDEKAESLRCIPQISSSTSFFPMAGGDYNNVTISMLSRAYPGGDGPRSRYTSFWFADSMESRALDLGSILFVSNVSKAEMVVLAALNFALPKKFQLYLIGVAEPESVATSPIEMANCFCRR